MPVIYSWVAVTKTSFVCSPAWENLIKNLCHAKQAERESATLTTCLTILGRFGKCQ
jgi:hypothetical protein